MTKKQTVQIFEERKVRSVWDDATEEWYFSVVDVVAVLTDSVDPKQYIKRMKSRDQELKANWGTICTLLPLKSADGKIHKKSPSQPATHRRNSLAAPSSHRIRPLTTYYHPTILKILLLWKPAKMKSKHNP